MDFDKSATLNAFRGKTVLITGTTGFVGKVILEKLLRSVPSVGRILLLIRGNRTNPTAELRFQNEVAGSSIFDTLRAGDPDLFDTLCQDKLRFVSGELTAPDFGLEAKEFLRLGQQVDLIINSAASVNFREPLDDALRINALSLHNIVKLAKVKQTPVVHISTCYVNGFNSGLIEETMIRPRRNRIAPASGGYYEVEPLIAELQQKVAAVSARHNDAKQREQALISLGLQEANRHGWNDTYTFTKWMGEQILVQHLDSHALTILRPSIVESTLQEPVPGWIEGVKVADAIIMAYAREKVTFFPGNKHAVIDIIPADLVANSVILGGAEALTAPRTHRIYQCSSSHCNPIPIKHVIKHVQDEAMENYQQHRNLFLRKPQRPFIMVPNLVFSTAIWLAFYLLKLRGQVFNRNSTVAANKLNKLETTMKLALVFSFYTRPTYTFSNSSLRALSERMGDVDQTLFPVDASTMNWGDYLRRIHLAGLNNYSLAPKVSRVRQQREARRTQAA